MESRSFSWVSEELGHDVELKRWGWFGKPLLLFPTHSGGCAEPESFGLLAALEPLVMAGRIKVFAVGCAPAESWTDRELDPAAKTFLQAAYDAHLMNEVVPRILEDCEDTELRFAAAGANIGAFNAVNVVAKHPERFDLAVGMSGTYDFDRWMSGHHDTDYYFNQPMRFVPNLDGEELAAVRTALFVIASGSGRWEEPLQTRRLASVLQAKGIPVSMEIWGEDADHDWPTWRTMLPLFLERSA